MRLKMQTDEKLADRFHPHTTFEGKGIERGHDETDEPLAALWRFPQPGFAMAISARHRLLEARHAAFGKPGLMGQLPNALHAVLEKKLEKPMTFIPKSHVGQSSKGRLKAVQHSIPLAYMTDHKLSRLTWIP
jgi:hypothetical protein